MHIPDPSDLAFAGAEQSASRLLLVEDNPLDAHLVRAMLGACGLAGDLALAGCVADARALLSERHFDLVLLDLFLPDASGLDALRQVRVLAPEIPIVVLTGRDDKEVALQAVREGAQDYLHKEGLDGEVLARAIRYGIERHRLLTEIRAMSLRDELTGLYNRRGFFTLAEQQLRVAGRTGRGMGVFFADLDGMKQINDLLGHEQGDRAIQEVTALLRGSFRASDIVARMGGDEFVVLALETDRDGIEIILRRLEERLAVENAVPGRAYALSLSTGAVLYDPAKPISVDELVSRADTAMYDQKRGKQHSPRVSGAGWQVALALRSGFAYPSH
jgi:two-component system, cell cycle response regulator